MDKPLKYFLLTLLVFTLLISFFLVASLKKGPADMSELPVLDPQDPLLVTAKSKAQQTLDTLFDYYPRYPDNTFVRFAFEVKKGDTEHIWARVIGVDDGIITVAAEEDDERFTGELELSEGEVEDWLVEIDKHNVLGGFTTQVLLIREAEDKPADSSRIDSLLQLFVYPVN